MKFNILIIGAHPDDADLTCGGFAAWASNQGHRVRMMSMTNGGTGHHEIGGVELAKRRYQEAQHSAQVIGAEYHIMDLPNNGLEPSLFLRYRMIEIIREFKADVIITHRLNDYHPDHRYTSLLVQDTSTAISNPNVCPLTPPLKQNPLYMYMSDTFQRPYPFTPDVVFAIDDLIMTKLEMVHQHASQLYEWMPYDSGIADQVPIGEEERKQWALSHYLNRNAELADAYRDKLVEKYGQQSGAAVKYAEALEFSEYGGTALRQQFMETFTF